MSKKYFTSDWHLGEDRIGVNGKPNLFYRPFPTVDYQDRTLAYSLIQSDFENGDEFWHLGDVIYSVDEYQCVQYCGFDFDLPESKTVFECLRVKFPDSKFHLIVGNYDEDKLDYLSTVFDSVQHEAEIEIKGRKYYLNHYPSKCIDKEFSITGHIHGLWKVQKNMVNVGVDAWHFKPVSEDEIDFCRTACEKYYDNNVFPYSKL